MRCFMALALALSGCTVTIDDGVKDFVELHQAPADFASRLAFVRNGTAVWGVGVRPTQSAGSASIAPIVWSGDLVSGKPALTWSSATGASIAYRLELAPHPRLPVAYLAGGIVSSTGGTSWAPSLQVLTPALTGPLTTADATLSYIHPTLASASFGIGEYPFDPVGYQTSNFSQTAYTSLQAPLALATYTDTASGTDRLVALLPHGLEGATAPADAHFNGGNSAVSHYHRRAIAFFDLDATGLVVDACPGAAELSYGGYSVATTEPSWIIDLPSTVFAEKAVVPSRLLTNDYGYSLGASDLRLYPLSSTLTTFGNASNQGDAALDRYFLHDQVMPAAPKLLLDPAHGRGYLFANRWVGDDATTSASTPLLDAAAAPGRAVLMGFSLASPARSGCARSGTGGNAFAGLEDTSASIVTATGVSPTAAIEPIVLVENFETQNGGSGVTDLFNNGSSQCSLFSNNNNTGSLPCFTDAVPYAPIALDAKTGRLLVTQSQSNLVLVFDGATLGAPVAQVAVGTTPVSVAVDGAGRAYVVNRGSDSLSVIDIATAAKVTDIRVGKRPVALYVDTGRAAGPLVYVLDLFGDNIAVVDPATRAVRYAPTCPRPAELFVDAVTRTAVVQCKGSIEYQRDNCNGDCGAATVSPTARSFHLLD